MGMDLYSVEGSKYFRFNVFGWIRVWNFLDRIGADSSELSGSNDGDIVSPDSCINISEHIETVHSKLKYLVKCPKNKLLEEMARANTAPIIVEYNDIPTNLALEIMQTRLKGEKFSVKRLSQIKIDWKDPFDLFSYYVEFGKFCRRCSELDGFKIC
jgi:hypothetical protein